MLTRKNIERLIENCGYDPEKIGKALMRALDYRVFDYVYSDSVYVYSKDGKKLIFARSR